MPKGGSKRGGKVLIARDTSGLFASLNRRDGDHERTKGALLNDRGLYLVPAGTMAKVAYLVERRPGTRVPDCGGKDLGRTRRLIARYADLPLGFADASAISCVERNGGRVLTLDLRHGGRRGEALPSP